MSTFLQTLPCCPCGIRTLTASHMNRIGIMQDVTLAMRSSVRGILYLLILMKFTCTKPCSALHARL
jgi:hypothetical protein